MESRVHSFSETVSRLLEDKKYNSARDVLITMEPVDIAALFEEVPPELWTRLFRLLPKDAAAPVFVELDPEKQAEIIRGYSETDIRTLLDELYVDDAADLIEEMPANVVEKILKSASPDMRRSINEILKYPESSTGSIMTTEFVAFHPDITLRNAIEEIRKSGVDKETIYTCYVIDRERHLIGCISARTLLTGDESKTVGELMDPNVISCNTLDDREETARAIGKYGFLALPVCDAEKRLVGIVTVDDAIDVMQTETSEDISKMAAVTPADKPYLKRSVFELYKSRIPWLLLLMISATLTGGIISSFEDALGKMVILTAFIPMLMDTGGNAGGQASVTIIRALSLDEVRFGNLPAVIWKELRVSVMAAVTLAAASFAKICLIDRPENIWVSLTVCLTLAAIVVLAKLIGCTLPILAKKIGLDPAVVASPFITTIVDAVALLVYFALASALLGL